APARPAPRGPRQKHTFWTWHVDVPGNAPIVETEALIRSAAIDLGPVTGATPVGGMVAPGFEEVRVEFERNFLERGEIGAAVSAYWCGEKVVDLWGGRRSPDADAHW